MEFIIFLLHLFHACFTDNNVCYKWKQINLERYVCVIMCFINVFLSFQNSSITITIKKINMLLETNGEIFLSTRINVTNQWRIDSEVNEHIFRGWCSNQRGLNVVQVIILEYNRHNFFNCLFRWGEYRHIGVNWIHMFPRNIWWVYSGRSICTGW